MGDKTLLTFDDLGEDCVILPRIFFVKLTVRAGDGWDKLNNAFDVAICLLLPE